jgi:hypothetical protein
MSPAASAAIAAGSPERGAGQEGRQEGRERGAGAGAGAGRGAGTERADGAARARRDEDRPQSPAARAGATTYTAGRRSPARATVLIVGAVVVGIAAIALVVSLVGSGSSAKSPSVASSASTSAAHAHHGSSASHSGSAHPSEPSTPTVSPAETQVAVLNGTTAEGLAHRLAANLQQTGYSQATALSGTPPGSHQTTVVEYSTGHHAEAAQVAQALGVSRVQPIEAAVSPLVGASTVVVIAGLDKAGSSTEASSGTGAGTGNEGAAAGGSEGAAAGGGGSTP